MKHLVRILANGWQSTEVSDDFAPVPAGAQLLAPEEFAAFKAGQPAPISGAPASDVPVSVTPRQIRRALTQAGLRAAVEAAVAAGSQDVRDDWEFSLEIRRDHPLLNAMAEGLGLTSAQLDELFRLADTIP